MVDVAIGGAILALREAFPYPDERISELEDKALPIAQRGAAESLGLALDAFERDVKEHSELLAVGRRRAQEWLQR